MPISVANLYSAQQKAASNDHMFLKPIWDSYDSCIYTGVSTVAIICGAVGTRNMYTVDLLLSKTQPSQIARIHSNQFFDDRLLRGAPCHIGPLSVCPVCLVRNVGVLWPNG